MRVPLSLASRGRPAAAVLVLLLLVSALLVGAPAAHARPRAHASVAGVPQGFVGVDIDGPLFDPDSQIDLNTQMASMVGNGVESVRAAFNWAAAQPYESWSQVPSAERSQFVTGPAGRPISYVATDEIVGDAARHGLSVLPTLLYAPAWDAPEEPRWVQDPSARCAVRRVRCGDGQALRTPRQLLGPEPADLADGR